MAEVSEDNKQIENAVEPKLAEDVLYPDKDVKVEAKPEEKAQDTVVEETKTETPKEEESELTLKAPEGSSLTEAEIAEMKEFAKTNKLSQEVAQKLLDEKAGFISKATEKSNADFKAKAESWLTEVKQIKTFDEDLKHSQQVLSDWFDPEFKKMLNETGLGNHPAMFKGLAKLGRSMSPQRMVQAPKNAVAPALEDYELFYGPDAKSS